MADLARASVEITDGSFDAEVMRSPLPILVEFGALWCEPCREMAPVMAKLNGEYAGRVRVGRLDVDTSPMVASRLGVMTIPTVVLFMGGSPVWRAAGFRTLRVLKAKVDETLSERA